MKNRLTSLLRKTAASPANGRYGGHVNTPEPCAGSGVRGLDKDTFSGSVSKMMKALKEMVRAEPMILLTRALLAAALLLTVAAVILVWYDSSVLASRVFALAQAATAPDVRQAHPATDDETDATLTQFANRRYFQSEAREKIVQSSPLNSAEVPGFAERYRLMGILMGDVPQAIVHENSTNTSMFLTKGQRLDGYDVRDIFSDRVLLQRGNDLINLRL